MAKPLRDGSKSCRQPKSRAKARQNIEGILEDLRKDPVEGTKIYLVDDDIFNWEVIVNPPGDSCYSGGEYHVSIKFNNDFPFCSPQFQMITPIYHMNINHNGMIKMDKICNWNHKYCTMRDIFNDLIELLRNPTPGNASVNSLAVLFDCNKQKYENNAISCTQLYAQVNAMSENKNNRTITEIHPTELRRLGDLPQWQKRKFPENMGVIENPCNKNEILFIGGFHNGSISIYNKQEKTFRQNKVDLTCLEQNGAKINLNQIWKVTVLNSHCNNDHVVVAFLDYAWLYYSIFDCQSYQWVNFNECSNCICEFAPINANNNQQLQCSLSSSMIAVENYIIITGSGGDYSNLDILDISNEMKPVHIHHSKMNDVFRFHGCVKLENENESTIDVDTTSIRLLLFGGKNVIFSDSIFELKITFRILPMASSGPVDYVVSFKANSNDRIQTIKDKYTDSNGKDIEIKIEYNGVPWKCNDDVDAPMRP